MTSFHQMEESEIIERLKHSDEHAFKWIFDQYHVVIYSFAIKFLKDEHQAEEITQTTVVPQEIENLIKQRDEARSDRNWEEADRLRGVIEASGFEIEDTPQGTKIRFKK